MKIAIVFGTRPEAIKLAPVVQALKEYFDIKIINTGQHEELLYHVIEFFKINIDYKLRCNNPDLIENTSCMVKSLKNVFKKERPNCIMVQGDTLTCYSAAYTAFLMKIPVLHVEAGLRSYNKFSPFPEEMFRILTDKLTDFAFAPTQKAIKNLLKEGFQESRILLTGNTVVDAVKLSLKLIDRYTIKRELEENLGVKFDSYSDIVLITSHRRESIGEPMKNIKSAIIEIAKKYPSVLFLWSLHKNPKVRKIVLEGSHKLPDNLKMFEPINYSQIIYLIEKSRVIITDSGGLQEEACTLKKPVIVVRNVSERSEVIEAGIGFLAGTDKHKIIKTFHYVFSNIENLSKLDFENPFGDGKASERIREFLLSDQFQRFITTYHKMR